MLQCEYCNNSITLDTVLILKISKTIKNRHKDDQFQKLNRYLIIYKRNKYAMVIIEWE